MRDIMPIAYVEGFVATCEAEGLSKSATAVLLQRQSVVDTAEEHPGFMEGYMKVARTVRGNTIPRVTDGFFEKEAVNITLKPVLDGLRRFSRSRAGKAMGSGLKTVAGNRAVQAGGVAAGGVGIGKYLMRDPGDAPYLPSGGYNPEDSAKMRQMQEDSAAQGVYDLNRQINQSSQRRKVLSDAVGSHDINSGKAQQELWKMDRDSASGEATRDRFTGRVNENTEALTGKLKDLEGQRAAIDAQRTSPWRAPLRWLGIEDNDTYDNRAMKVEDAASRASQNLRLNEQSQNLIANGVVGRTPTPPPMKPQAFFPTH